MLDAFCITFSIRCVANGGLFHGDGVAFLISFVFHPVLLYHIQVDQVSTAAHLQSNQSKSQQQS
jgi:hypothetical protein